MNVTSEGIQVERALLQLETFLFIFYQGGGDKTEGPFDVIIFFLQKKERHPLRDVAAGSEDKGRFRLGTIGTFRALANNEDLICADTSLRRDEL